jgi:hypothetical protein
MSAFGGKADIDRTCPQCPLLTQSGHGYTLTRPLDSCKSASYTILTGNRIIPDRAGGGFGFQKGNLRLFRNSTTPSGGREWLCQNFQWKVDASAGRCAIG